MSKYAPARTFTFVTPAAPSSVAEGLRYIADLIEREQLCLIGLWSTGFGEPHEAALQVVVDAATVSEGQVTP